MAVFSVPVHYASSKNWQKLTAAQPLPGQAVPTAPVQASVTIQITPPPPLSPQAELGRAPNSATALAFALIVH